MNNLPIIDFHTHPYLSAEEFYCFYPDAFEPSALQCMEDARRAGITHICGSVILNKKYDGGFDYIKDCNDRAFGLKKIMGDFYTAGFHIHPDFVRESIAEIELRVKQGFGIIGELVPYMHGWSDYSQRNLSEILDAAEHYHLPVSFHTISREPTETDKMIEAHPHVTFIAAHPGDKEQFLAHLERIKKHENYYLDLSGTGIFRYGLIAHGVRKVGSERLIFGTDYPICNPKMYVEAVLHEPISEGDMENILFKNAGRILGISPQRLLKAMEQEIINKVVAEKAKYKHLVADPPHEQDNIPNPFDVLTLEETRYLQEHRYLLKQIEALW